MADQKPGNRQKTGNSTSFKPGQSGNPNGRPKQTPEQQNALEAIRRLAPQAPAVLENIMKDPKAPHAARIKAVEIVLDRTYGKPDQRVAVEDDSRSVVADIRAEMQRIRDSVAP